MFLSYLQSSEKISDGFKEAFYRLKNFDPERDADEKLWQTRHKVVVRYTVPDGVIAGKSDYQVVWKYYGEKRFFRYLFRPSLAYREWQGYKNVEAVGIPVAKALAAAETRRGVRLVNCVFVTEMVRDTGDGDDFCPGGSRVGETALAKEFAEKNLRLLAKLHRAKLVHGGFTPRNVLYKIASAQRPGELEVVWIDLATCRKVPFYKRRKLQQKDVDCFLGMLQLTPENDAALRKIYQDEVDRLA